MSTDERREREVFAVAALQGLLANSHTATVVTAEEQGVATGLAQRIAERAWLIADEMVRARRDQETQAGKAMGGAIQQRG